MIQQIVRIRRHATAAPAAGHEYVRTTYVVRTYYVRTTYVLRTYYVATYFIHLRHVMDPLAVGKGKTYFEIADDVVVIVAEKDGYAKASVEFNRKRNCQNDPNACGKRVNMVAQAEEEDAFDGQGELTIGAAFKTTCRGNPGCFF